LADAIYANGLAVGTLAAGGRGGTNIKCDASAAYTHSSQSLELTLSKCLRWSNNGIPIVVPVAGTISLPTSSSGFSLKGFTIDGVVFPVVVGDGLVKFGGPTGQELVGAVTVGASNNYFTFAFGAKK
jgi:hypothetical protein